MTTEQFGAQWGSHVQEQKCLLKNVTKCQNTAAFMEVAKQKFNLNPVQEIKNEAILRFLFLFFSIIGGICILVLCCSTDATELRSSHFSPLLVAVFVINYG